MHFLRTKLVSLFHKRWYRDFDGEDWGRLNLCYSQFGEDVALDHFIKKKNGFYVDVGAFQPVWGSNTYVLYKKHGWRGINIDANETNIKLFSKKRFEDVNLFLAISDEEQELEYHQFDPGQFNTLSREMADEFRARKGIKYLGSRKIKTKRLDEVLKEHMEEGQEIDLLSVDCEGCDLEVLKSNDWNMYRPHLIMAEDHGEDIETPLTDFCKDQGYKMVNWVGPTKVFREV